jgi:shikimate kinase/3-dehydroquinate synthase
VRVLLIGFMGAGKTTVGRLLAERLRMPFADLDSEIEARTGLAVRELFSRHGEPEFRRVERELLAELLTRDPLVLATGGGTLVDPDNLALARGAGLVVWLNPPFAAIARRVGPLGKQDRPLFPDEAAAFDLYRRRLPVYRQADLQIDVAAEESAVEVASRTALRLAEMSCST